MMEVLKTFLFVFSIKHFVKIIGKALDKSLFNVMSWLYLQLGVDAIFRLLNLIASFSLTKYFQQEHNDTYKVDVLLHRMCSNYKRNTWYLI